MTVEELFSAAGLSLHGPVAWGEGVPERGSGIYIIATRTNCDELPRGSNFNDLKDTEQSKERSRWIPGGSILYIGMTDRSIRQRISEFRRHVYGERSPHRGGQAIHLLNCDRWIYWSPCAKADRVECDLVEAFLAEYSKLPYANRMKPQRCIKAAANTLKKTRSIAVVNIGQLVTLAGPPRPRVGAEMRELGLVSNAALLIEGGRIVAAGTYAELRSRVDSATEVLDAGGRLVTPGFVDAHTHLVFAGNRAAEFERRIGGATYQEIAAAGGGIQSTVAITRAATEEELLAQARKHRDWMLRGGTTTIEAKSGYGLDWETELRILRVIRRLGGDSEKPGPMRMIPTLLAAHTVPREMADRRGEYVRWVAEELIPEVALLKLAKYCDAFCDDHAFTVAETRIVLEAAKRHGLGLRIHAEQFRPGTGAALGAELGAATVDHLETVTDETLALMKAARTMPVLLPASVFCLGREQYPPARRMIEMGLPVAVATDFNAGSSPAASMAFTMSLACIEMRMLPAEALVAATINPAYSLGLGDEVGSLETGKAADFVIHEAEDYRELAYYAAAPMRPRVFVAGVEV